MGHPIPNVGTVLRSTSKVLKKAASKVLAKAVNQKPASSEPIKQLSFTPTQYSTKVVHKPGQQKAKKDALPDKDTSKRATVPWSQIHKYTRPTTKTPPLQQLLKLDDRQRAGIINPRWLPRGKKLFPYRYTERRPHPTRRFYWDREEQKRTRFYIFDNEVPGLHKIGHPIPPLTLHPSMVASVEVLTTPTADTPGGSVFLRFDNRSYVFGNASEGSQRVFTSRGMSMAKIEDIFLTGLIDWHGVGGLLGMVLTLADIRTSKLNDRDRKDAENPERAVKRRKENYVDPLADFHLNIHGGKNLTHMLATARGFIYRNGYPLRPQEVREDPRPEATCDGTHDWEDENIKVWHVPVVASEQITPTEDRGTKRTFDSMSADGEDTNPENAEGLAPTAATKRTPEEIAQDQELVLGVVKGMFNEDGYVEALVETKLEDVTWANGGLYAEKPGSKGGEIVPYKGEMVPKANVIARKKSPVPMLPPTEPARMSMCYIVKTKVQRGKFFPEKATALGVQKTDFKNLAAGLSVTGHGGLTVTPDMVLGPTPDPNGFAVVELPNESYIEPFLARPEWKHEDIMRGLRAMYWNVRDNKVLENDKIIEFMERHKNLRHIIMTRTADISPIVLEGAAVETTKLHMIDPDVFPLLPYSDPSVANKSDKSKNWIKSWYHARQGEEILLSPKLRYNDDKKLDPIDVRKALSTFASENAEVIQLADAAKRKVSDPSFLAAIEQADADIPNRDAEIIPLGTGSALPSKTRNVSCTLIRVPGIGNYLLDCGENSLGQLRRMYGYSGADAILRDLKAIWISHSHADHHLGTISILRRYSEVIGPLSPSSSPPIINGVATKPLALIAHPTYHNFITEYASIEPFGLDTHVHQIPHALPSWSGFPAYSSSSPKPLMTNYLGRKPDVYRPNNSHPPSLLAHFGIEKLVVCKVDHCPDSYALALTLTSGLKIAYSGDCRPSREFAHRDVGGDAHLLIHEATLEDSKVRDAIAKKHSTVSEALRVAQNMNARNVLLTHFSQRYPAMPVLDGMDGFAGRDVPVLVAFDFMRVRLGDFRRAREFLPALQKMYEKPEEEEAKVEEEMEKVDKKVIKGQRAAA